MEAEAETLDKPLARFLCVGLGLVFLGRGESADAILMALRSTVTHKIVKLAELTVQTCAYAGSGDVLQVQKMLHHCAEHLSGEDDDKPAEFQGVASLGIALCCAQENVGREMALRSMDHLLQYGENPVR